MSLFLKFRLKSPSLVDFGGSGDACFIGLETRDLGTCCEREISSSEQEISTTLANLMLRVLKTLRVVSLLQVVNKLRVVTRYCSPLRRCYFLFFGTRICRETSRCLARPSGKVLGEGLKLEDSQKWLGEGARGLLCQWRQRPLALVQKRVAQVQNRVLVVQETLGRPLLPGSKTPFASSPNHFWALLRFRALVAGTRGCDAGLLHEQ